MLRSPWELDAHVRYLRAHLVTECRRCSRIDRAGSGSQGRLAKLRRYVGIGLIQIGATIAGHDVLHRHPTPQVWSALAKR